MFHDPIMHAINLKAVKRLVQLTLSFMYHYSANPRVLGDDTISLCTSDFLNTAL
jgi:hypothetical protein